MPKDFAFAGGWSKKIVSRVSASADASAHQLVTAPQSAANCSAPRSESAKIV
jgi:hypothetical protein